MLKTDFKKEIESTLDLIKIGIDKDLIDGNSTEALKRINRGMKGILGLDISTVDTLSFNNVIELVSKENQCNFDKYMALGELLYFQGYVYESLKDEISKMNYYQKALMSFYEAYKDCNDIDKRYREDIVEILEFLNEFETSLEDQDIIFKFYEYLRYFDKAEDTLFGMIKQSSKDEKIIHEGIEFYNRLKNMPEDTLIEGNLPLDEVNDSLKQIENMLK